MKETKNQKIKAFAEFASNTDTGTEYSHLWQDYAKSFMVDEGALITENARGYTINTKYSPFRYKRTFMLAMKIKNKLVDVISMLHKKIERFINFLYFRDANIPTKYGFDILADVTTLFKKRFPKKWQNYGLLNHKLGHKYSHTSLKLFYYLSIFEKHVDIKSLEQSRILEIGAGMCNFAIMLTSKLDNFDYVIIDLPEVIAHGYISLLEFHPDKEIQIFLPHELDLYKKSTAKKKILFILPSQLNEVGDNFALLLNHESFSEMRIHTVNEYLKKAIEKQKVGAFTYIVGRYTRNTSGELTDVNGWTNFPDYHLSGLEQIHYQIDGFRSLIPHLKRLQNVMYIGKKVE